MSLHARGGSLPAQCPLPSTPSLPKGSVAYAESLVITWLRARGGSPPLAGCLPSAVCQAPPGAPAPTSFRPPGAPAPSSFPSTAPTTPTSTMNSSPVARARAQYSPYYANDHIQFLFAYASPSGPRPPAATGHISDNIRYSCPGCIL